MNEYYDMAAQDEDAAVFDLGFDSLHGLGADEILMRAEEPSTTSVEMMRRREMMRCLMSVIVVVTWRVGTLREIRDRVAVLAAAHAPEMMGRRVWQGREWAVARGAMARCPELFWVRDAGRMMLALLTVDGWTERAVGMRALCFCYALIQDKSVRPQMAWSLETMGEAVGLTANNKRSAMSAAVQRVCGELVLRMGGRKDAKFWFMKSAQCRDALARAMKGKRNRLRRPLDGGDFQSGLKPGLQTTNELNDYDDE